jgi:hypothetical protein
VVKGGEKMGKRFVVLFMCLLMIALFVVGSQGPVSALYQWQLQSLGVTNYLYDVEYNGSLYVIVGMTGLIATSTDGSAWTMRTSGVTADLMSVVWNGKFFVAVGDRGTILTSTDGKVWTPRQSAATEKLVKIIWTGTTFVASAQGPSSGLPGSVPYGAVIKSVDGINWSYAKTVGTQSYVADLLWNGTKYIGVGIATGTPTAIIYTSTDAVNWTVIKPGSPVVGNLMTITWNSARYVSGGMYGIVATSTNAATWTVGQIKTAMNGIKDITYNSAGFVAVGGSGDIYTGTDGINWIADTSPTKNALFSIKWTGKKFIVVGANGTILNSL